MTFVDNTYRLDYLCLSAIEALDISLNTTVNKVFVLEGG